VTLPTSDGRSRFRYSGSVAAGTEIQYGKGFRNKASVSAQQYSALLTHFSEGEIPIGASRDNQPKGSLGEWLTANVTATAIASYVAPILIAEKRANPGSRRGWIKFA
jgi:hypothetical protein